MIFKGQKNVYQIEEDDFKFNYVLNKIDKRYTTRGVHSLHPP